ncbi:MAG: hypothetical protein ACMG6E_05675 [Candidatus Roizmanbacteria bacterium]
MGGENGGGVIKDALEVRMKHKLQQLQKEEITKRMLVRYNKYFRHWRDFDLLTCILAMIGLIL